MSVPAPHASGLLKALALGGDTHSLADVEAQIKAGDAQLWTADDALIVTEVNIYPRKRVLHFWLATGELKPVVELSKRALEWGKGVGCEYATIAGRSGWERALKHEGWSPMLTYMRKAIR